MNRVTGAFEVVVCFWGLFFRPVDLWELAGCSFVLFLLPGRDRERLFSQQKLSLKTRWFLTQAWTRFLGLGGPGTVSVREFGQEMPPKNGIAMDKPPKVAIFSK